MKNRASLVLMEQLIMILVFSLAAALCLQIFVKTDARSRQTQRYSSAVVLAQNGAEAMKAAAGDPEQAAAILGGWEEDGCVVLQQEELLLQVTPQPSATAGLGIALVTVSDERGDLFSLTAAWQEVAP